MQHTSRPLLILSFNQVLCSVILLLAIDTVFSADEDPRITRLIEVYEGTAKEAEADLQKTIHEAAQKRAEDLTKARDKAVVSLRRTLKSRSDAVSSAKVYRIILSFNPLDTDARQFFEAFGGLDDVLAEVKPRLKMDMLGNPLSPVKPGARPGNGDFSQEQAESLISTLEEFTQKDWDSLQGLTITLSSKVPWTMVRGVDPGDKVLVVAAPDDRWGGRAATQSAEGGDPFSTGKFMELRSREQQIGLAGIVVVSQIGLHLGATDTIHKDNSGSMRVKILSVQ